MLVQGEFYGTPDKNGLVAGDSRKEVEERPDFVVFNGMIDRYVEHPIPIKVGELVRVFFVNAGPNLSSTFHVTGAIFSTVYRGGNPADAMHDLASFEVGPGDGAVFEFRVHEPGDYEFIDHALARTTKGAEGVFAPRGSGTCRPREPRANDRDKRQISSADPRKIWSK